MVADKGKKPKVVDNIDQEYDEELDAELLQSMEKLQEIQDELEKVTTLFFLKSISQSSISLSTYPIRLKLSSQIPH